jgi:hypothetical protein
MGDYMVNFLAALFLFLLSFGVGVVTMIHGWGVQPESWVVIMLGWFASIVLMSLATAVGK